MRVRNSVSPHRRIFNVVQLPASMARGYLRSMDAPFPPAVANLTEGRTLHAFGETVIIHLDSESTGAKLNLWTEISPPGGGPPPHHHEREDEWFLVQEGQM